MENYDREVRPVYNASHPVEVKVGITLTQIFDMVSSYGEERQEELSSLDLDLYSCLLQEIPLIFLD